MKIVDNHPWRSSREFRRPAVPPFRIMTTFWTSPAGAVASNLISTAIAGTAGNLVERAASTSRDVRKLRALQKLVEEYAGLQIDVALLRDWMTDEQFWMAVAAVDVVSPDRTAIGAVPDGLEGLPEYVVGAVLAATVLWLSGDATTAGERLESARLSLIAQRLDHVVGLSNEIRSELLMIRRPSRRVATLHRLLTLPVARPTSEPNSVGALRPQNRLVPYIDPYDRLGELSSWMDSDIPAGVCALLAGAGQGKTRLALELCIRVRNQRGWAAGFLDPITPGSVVDAIAGAQVNRLVVLDYAELQATNASALLRMATVARAFKLRVLVLIRDLLPDWTGASWQIRLFGPGYADLLTRVETKEVLLEADAHLNTLVERAAIGAFGLQIEPDVAYEVLGSPLRVIARIQSMAFGGESANSGDYAASMAHEKVYWNGIGPPSTNDAVLARMVAGACLLPAVNEHQLEHFGLATTVDSVVWAAWLRRAYPDSGGVIAPDELAEFLVGTAIANGLLTDSAFSKAVSIDRRFDGAQAVHMLASACRLVPGAAANVVSSVERSVQNLVKQLVDETTSEVSDSRDASAFYFGIATLIRSVGRDFNTIAISELIGPDRSDLGEIPLALAEIEEHQALSAVEPDPDRRRRLGRSRVTVSARLTDLGIPAMGVERLRLAVADFEDSLGFAPDRRQHYELGIAKNNLSIALRARGEYDGAIMQAAGAIDAMERASERGIDRALNVAFVRLTLVRALTDAGQIDDALQTCHRLIRDRRKLVRANLSDEGLHRLCLALEQRARIRLERFDVKADTDGQARDLNESLSLRMQLRFRGYPDQVPWIAVCHYLLAVTNDRAGNSAMAVWHAQAAVEWAESNQKVAPEKLKVEIAECADILEKGLR